MKESPGDFRVREVSAYPTPDPDGAYTILRIESVGWEQHELAEAIARRLGLPHRAIDWAGTKDRRAVSERLFSYRGVPPRGGLDLPRVVVQDVYRARDGVRLGHHYGNSFDIVVRSLPADPAASLSAAAAIRAELRRGPGIPNFFGPQRFGEVRPITHEVGRALVRGDPAGAVDIYLTATPSGVGTEGGDARRAYAEHRDAARALREFPSEYRFERTLLEHLAKGHPPERALRALSHELRLLFVHAYQSWIFNRWLTARWRAGSRFDRPEAGDSLLRLGRDGTIRADAAVRVELDNRPECADLVARGRAVVAGPLVGYETTIGAGPADETLARILAEENVAPGAFRLPRTPEVASAGAYRPALVPTPPIALSRTEEEAPGLRFVFSLPKGAYATVLLREFLKLGATRARDSNGAF